MHEVSTSQALAELVLKESRGRGAKRVIRIEVEIGRLTFLNPDQVAFWVGERLKGTIADGAELNIRLIEPLVACETCGYRGQLPVEEDPLVHWVLPSLRCSRCGETGLTVERGRECTLRRIGLLSE